MSNRQTPYMHAMDAISLTDEQKAGLVNTVLTRAETQAGVQAEAQAAPQGIPIAAPQAVSPRTAHTADARRPKRPAHRRLTVPALVAALLGAGICGVALAAAMFHLYPIDVAERFFGASADDPDAAELVDRIGTNGVGSLNGDGARVWSDGVLISVDAVLGDSHNAAIVLSIARDNGGDLGLSTDPTTGNPSLVLASRDEEGNPASLLDIEGHPAGYSGGYAYDDNPDDSAVQYLLTVSSPEESLIGRTVHLHITDLLTVDNDERGEPIWRTVVEGPWELDFTLDYEDTSREFEAEPAVVSVDSIDATVSGLSISPIAVTLDFAATVDLDEAGYLLELTESQLEFSSLPVSLVMRDGSRIALGDYDIESFAEGGWNGWLGSGSSWDGGGGLINPNEMTGIVERSATRTIYASEFIDVDGIVAIVVGDTEIPVTPIG